jgi:hypothetical protein
MPCLTVGATTRSPTGYVESVRCKPPIRGIRCTEAVLPRVPDLLLQEEQWLILWQSILMEPLGLCPLTPKYRG